MNISPSDTWSFPNIMAFKKGKRKFCRIESSFGERRYSFFDLNGVHTALSQSPGSCARFQNARFDDRQQTSGGIARTRVQPPPVIITRGLEIHAPISAPAPQESLGGPYAIREGAQGPGAQRSEHPQLGDPCPAIRTQTCDNNDSSNSRQHDGVGDATRLQRLPSSNAQSPAETASLRSPGARKVAKRVNKKSGLPSQALSSLDRNAGRLAHQMPPLRLGGSGCCWD